MFYENCLLIEKVGRGYLFFCVYLVMKMVDFSKIDGK